MQSLWVALTLAAGLAKSRRTSRSHASVTSNLSLRQASSLTVMSLNIPGVLAIFQAVLQPRLLVPSLIVNGE